jgi:multicomponent Na+:H+ antiporter subunit E
MIRVINIALTVLLTWFTLESNEDITMKGGGVLLLFSGWYILFWLLSYFYSKRAFYQTPIIFGLIAFYVKELILASLKVAYEVITVRNHMNPAVVAVPLDAKSNLEITLLANLVTLTPGTLSIDVSSDRKTLYVHAMYLDDADSTKVIKDIKEGFEKRILKITRDHS